MGHYNNEKQKAYLKEKYYSRTIHLPKQNKKDYIRLKEILNEEGIPFTSWIAEAIITYIKKYNRINAKRKKENIVMTHEESQALSLAAWIKKRDN